MPRPKTFLDYEIVEKIQAFFLDNTRFPTIAEIKKWGCGDTRAQTLLKTAKGLQPEPQPKPQTKSEIADRRAMKEFLDPTPRRSSPAPLANVNKQVVWIALWPGEFKKCPKWIKERARL